MSFVGLSLSKCVADIARGKVDVEDVEKIFTGTCYTTPEERAAVIASYTSRVSAWHDLPTAVRIFNYLEAQNKIVQVRTLNLEPPNVAHGSWVTMSVPDVAARLWKKEPFEEAFDFSNEIVGRSFSHMRYVD